MDGLTELVEAALREDIGSGDLTTAATVAENAGARALITQKAPGSIYGLAAAESVFMLRRSCCSTTGTTSSCGRPSRRWPGARGLRPAAA